jgi:hypothetical protein
VDDESVMAVDCIACAAMPTAAWLMPVAVQNRITRSCAVSGVAVFAMAAPAEACELRRQKFNHRA